MAEEMGDGTADGPDDETGGETGGGARPGADVAAIPLCNASDLQNAGDAVPFDVIFQGQTSCAFAIRYAGQAHAYLNRCAHVPMEMDFQPNRFFDVTGHWLICATHGATYHPATGACAAGPLRHEHRRCAVRHQLGRGR